jgi:hypothetical protein
MKQLDVFGRSALSDAADDADLHHQPALIPLRMFLMKFLRGLDAD